MSAREARLYGVRGQDQQGIALYLQLPATDGGNADRARRYLSLQSRRIAWLTRRGPRARTVMPTDGCARRELSAPAGCSATASGSCDLYRAGTPPITTGTARASPAVSDRTAATASPARRRTCRPGGTRCPAA